MATDSRLKSRSLPAITDRLVDTYIEYPTIHHLDHCPLPNRQAIQAILDDLFDLIYPGFRHRQNLQISNVLYHAGNLVVNLHDSLTEQICRALRHYCPDEAAVGLDLERLSQEKAIEFLDALPKLRHILAEDVLAAYEGDPAAVNPRECVFCYPGVEAVTTYRFANQLFRQDIPLIPRLMAEIAHSKTGIDIHPGASIGPSFFIDHGTGVVIGGTTEIGQNVKLYQGVTLGALSFPRDDQGKLVRDRKRHPTIEDNVVIYANATILGGETVIGHDSVVGSSVWLTSSIEPFSVVTLEEPKLKTKSRHRHPVPAPASQSVENAT